MNVSRQHGGENHRNGKGTVTNNNGQMDEGIEQFSGIVTPMITHKSVESRRTVEVNNDLSEVGKELHANMEDQQQQELHKSNSMECGEGDCAAEQPSHPSPIENLAFDAYTPRMLRSYGQHGQGWFNMFVYIFKLNK